MPYVLILPGAAIVLVLRYTISSKASERSKYIVGGVSGASFICPTLFLYGGYVAMLLQFGVCFFLLFYRIVTTHHVNEGQHLNQL
ncbi:hypothetical protein BH10PLA2_BH10PLA2_13660 [soil metagenome]